jgi:predicted dehydrogenase
MASVKLALLGAGGAALSHHLPILTRLHDVEVAAIADASVERLGQASRMVPRAVACRDWQEAIGVPGVQAAIVCLPNTLHADAAVSSLGLGLHVYVEKPLAPALAAADRIVAAWRDAGTVGMTGFNYRFNALYRSARRLFESGALGEPVAAQSVFSIAGGNLPGWKVRRGDGGGALLDLGSHHIDLAAWLFGAPVVEVVAGIRSRETEDDTVTVDLRLSNGLVVQSLFAFGAGDSERFEVHGTRGRLVVERGRYQNAIFELHAARRRRLYRASLLVRDLARVRYALEKRFTPGHEPSHRAALAAFAEACVSGDQVRPDLEDGRRCVAIVDAAERSARSGAPERPAITAADVDAGVAGSGNG